MKTKIILLILVLFTIILPIYPNECEENFLESLKEGKDPIIELQILKEKINFNEKDKDFNKRMEFFLKGIREIAQRAMKDEIKRKGELVEELLKLRKKLLETKPITYKKIVIDNVIRMLINGIAFQALGEKDDKSIKIIKKALIKFNKANYYTPELMAKIFKEEMGLDFKTKGKTIYDIFEECIIKKKILKSYNKSKPVFDNLAIEVFVGSPKMTGLKEQLKEFSLYSFVFTYSFNDIAEYISQVATELYLKKVDLLGRKKILDVVEAIERLKTNIRLEDLYKINMNDLIELKKHEIAENKNREYKVDTRRYHKTLDTIFLIEDSISTQIMKNRNGKIIISSVIDYVTTLEKTHY